MSLRKLLTLSMIVITGISITACTKPPRDGAAASAAVKETAGHSHEGWWCDEHGVPEEECAQCNTKLVADFKAKGDWCGKHNRPDSHCFVCHPEKETEYAALYEAKYGKKPPKPETGAEEEAKKAA